MITTASDAAADLGRSTLAKVGWRLLPFLLLLYVVAWLDRVNIGFAALQMNADLGFSAAVYGFGAGIFFIGYALFEVPSNLILARVGARLWIARIMITWGILSVAMMFVSGRDELLRAALPARRRGSRLPAGHHLLPRQLVSREGPSARGLVVHARDSAVDRRRRTAGGPDSRSSTVGMGSRAGSGCSCSKAFRPSCSASSCSCYLTDSPDQAEWLEPDERRWLTERVRAEQHAAQQTPRRRPRRGARASDRVAARPRSSSPAKPAATGSRCGSRRSCAAYPATATSTVSMISATAVRRRGRRHDLDRRELGSHAASASCTSRSRARSRPSVSSRARTSRRRCPACSR